MLPLSLRSPENTLRSSLGLIEHSNYLKRSEMPASATPARIQRYMRTGKAAATIYVRQELRSMLRNCTRNALQRKAA